MLIEFEVKILLPIIRLGCLLEKFEQVLDAVCGERRLAQGTHDLEHRPVNLEVVLNDGNEAVGDYIHICSDFESDAMVSISKPGQGVGGLKRCA